jgi:hypothetical protein
MSEGGPAPPDLILLETGETLPSDSEPPIVVRLGLATREEAAS